MNKLCNSPFFWLIVCIFQDEDDCDGCRVGLGLCEDKKTCLADFCQEECRPGLVKCGYGGAGVQCAPSFGGFGKSESSNVDCMDWTRRQVVKIYFSKCLI